MGFCKQKELSDSRSDNIREKWCNSVREPTIEIKIRVVTSHATRKKGRRKLNGRPRSQTIFIQFSNKQKHVSRVKSKQNVKI
jgi:hypothetical protein